MLALGVDPGTRHLGWGVVRRDGPRVVHVAHGVIDLDTEAPLASRLVCLDTELARVVGQHRPSVGAVESLFFHKDAQAAAKLGHARGVVLLALARAGVPIAEYAPARVKRTIAGHGRAEKRQIALLVRALLGLPTLPRPDAADALAIAIAHLRLGGAPVPRAPRPSRARAELERLVRAQRARAAPSRVAR
ncbi:MAG: crossover junction endodeoxyribonuclease RuvC [Polyangiaceae bacterium]|nr:crossover junction endodeoxyribonuclease RuvC [Polyangiaceae bacterium]